MTIRSVPTTTARQIIPDTAGRLQFLLSTLAQAPAPRTRKGCFSSELFLSDLISRSSVLPSVETVGILDRLCKKIDVTQHVRAFYSCDLSRNVNHDSIHRCYATVLMGTLIHFAISCNDYKFLNSALKMQDRGLNNEPVNVPNVLNEWIERFLSDLRLPEYENS